MTSKQRLTVASVWALEDLGVQEITEGLEKALPEPDPDRAIEYDKKDDLLVVNGGNASSHVAKFVADYIEEQRHKDLLEVPRVRQLDIPVAIENLDNNPGQLGVQQGELLALEDGSEDTIIPYGVEEVTKFWISPNGDLGSFTNELHDVLAAVGSSTGTNTSVSDANKGIRVSGSNERDVNEALAKLTRIDESLSGLNNPQMVGNLTFPSGDYQLHLHQYGSLNQLALSRILIDPNLSSNVDHGQMFVTAEWHYESMNQSYHLPLNLANPPRSSEEVKASQIWNDFCFQEIGTGDEYLAMESIAEAEPTSVGTELPNPYISPQKDDEIRKWREQTKPECMEQISSPTLDEELETTHPIPPVSPPKPGPPFIKTRRPKPSGQTTGTQDSLDSCTATAQVNQVNSSVIKTSEVPKLRKRWKSIYNQETGLEKSEDIAEGEDPLCSTGPTQNHITSSSINDLAGLVWESDHSRSISTVPEAPSVLKSSTTGSLSEQSRRLDSLKDKVIKGSHQGPSISRRHSNARSLPRQLLARQVIEAYEKSSKSDMPRQVNEIRTRKFHQTMIHKAGKGKANKAKSKAKRQATLAEAWGLPSKPSKERTTELPNDSLALNGEKSAIMTAASHQATKGRLTQDPDDADREHIKELYNSIKATLESGECFPGPLVLEIQIGILLIPTLPKTWENRSMNRNEWNRVFQPRGGIPAPTVNFINRITSSGSDVDYILGLKTTREQGKHCLFEKEYTDYNVCYEFHCLTKTNKALVIVVQEDGKHTIKKSSATLGAVNLHFPGHIWDARVALSGSITPAAETTPELQAAAQYLVSHIWVRPGSSLQIFTKVPKDNGLKVDKVIMRRWTRHRHVRPDATPTETSSKHNTLLADQRSDGSNHEDQNVFIQFTEVQNLFIAKHSVDSQAVRARSTTFKEMTKTGRMWYEVSIVSPVIETILETNAGLEVGERTEDWRSVDLFGKDAMFLCDQSTDLSETSPSLSPIAREIGSAGLGDLFRLAKTVVGKIDSVGYWNSGPTRTTPGAALSDAYGTAKPAGNIYAGEPNGLERDELESIKDVRSAVDHSKQSSFAAGESAEQAGYW